MSDVEVNDALAAAWAGMTWPQAFVIAVLVIACVYLWVRTILSPE